MSRSEISAIRKQLEGVTEPSSPSHLSPEASLVGSHPIIFSILFAIAVCVFYDLVVSRPRMKKKLRGLSYREQQEFLGKETFDARDGRLPGERPLPFFKKRYINTKAEHRFYRELTAILPHHFDVAVKVRLLDLVKIRDGNWDTYGASLSWKHVDFVVFDHQTGETKLALELDDATHKAPERQNRDHFVNKTFQQIGVPLHRFYVSEVYDFSPVLAALGVIMNGAPADDISPPEHRMT